MCFHLWRLSPHNTHRIGRLFFLCSAMNTMKWYNAAAEISLHFAPKVLPIFLRASRLRVPVRWHTSTCCLPQLNMLLKSADSVACAPGGYSKYVVLCLKLKIRSTLVGTCVCYSPDRCMRRRVGHPPAVSPQIVGSHVLGQLLQRAADYLGHSQVSKAVIAVPAKFDARQRAATLEAFRLAGLQVCFW